MHLRGLAVSAYTMVSGEFPSALAGGIQNDRLSLLILLSTNVQMFLCLLPKRVASLEDSKRFMISTGPPAMVGLRQTL